MELPTEWKNIFANDISSERLISKIYKDLTQLNNKKQPGENMGRRWEWTFCQKRNTDGQQSQAEMLNITNYQRKRQLLSHVQLFVTLWTTAHQTPLSMTRILQWVAISFFRGSPQPRDQTWVPYIAGGFFTSEPPGKSNYQVTSNQNCNEISSHTCKNGYYQMDNI